MSANEPNWADKANLASNVLQNVQLHELQSSLRTLGALHAEKISLELSEQQAREREDRLREGLWQMENSFNKLVRDTAVTPCAMCVLTNQVQNCLARFGVTTRSFRQLADKDRIGAFEERLQQTIEDVRGKLSPEQKADIETFFRFSAELDELNFLWEKNEEAANRTKAEQQYADVARKLQQILEPFIDRKSAEQMRMLEQTMTANDEEATKISNSPDWETDEATDRWLDALDRRDHAATTLRQLIQETCERLRQNRLAQSAKPKSFLAGLAAGLQAASPAKPIAPDTIQEISALEIVMQSNAEVANRPADSGGARATELMQKYGGKAESWRTKIAEREAFVFEFRQICGLPPGDAFDISPRQQPSRRELSPEVRELAREARNKLAAIQLHRNQTGASLAEAKEAVESFIERGSKSR